MPELRRSPSPQRAKRESASASRSSAGGKDGQKQVRKRKQKKAKGTDNEHVSEEDADTKKSSRADRKVKRKKRKEKKGGGDASDSGGELGDDVPQDAEQATNGLKGEGRKKRRKRRRDGSDASAGTNDKEDHSGEGEKRKRRRVRKKNRKEAGKETADDRQEPPAGSLSRDGSGGGNSKSEDDSGDGADKAGRKKRRRRKRVGKKHRRRKGDEEDEASKKDGKEASGSEDAADQESSDDGDGGGRRRRHRRRHHHRRRNRRSASRSRSRSPDGPVDRRPMIERAKGGVKLFIGRLPLEASQQVLKSAVEEYGEVLEVFLIDSSRRTSGARCAFVRIDTLEHAERAINEMHEKRVLLPDRKELGPIQVAFAKGEAQRLGLDMTKEQLPSRWQVPEGGGPGKGIPSDAVDPDSLTKEALISLVKEGQRSGGQSFKSHWWGYCDSGKGSVHDYDPKRHPRSSLRQFFEITQQSEFGGKPWFRRAVQWSALGGRRRHRRNGSSGSSSSSSRSSSDSGSSSASSARRKGIERRRAVMAMQSAAAVAPAVLPTKGAEMASAATLSSAVPPSGAKVQPSPGLGSSALGELIRGTAPPPAPADPPPPEPPAASSQRLAPASQQDEQLEAFLARHRISPATSFLMLKLTKQQAAVVMEGIGDAVAKEGASGSAEAAVLSRLKRLGIQSGSAGGGSWTSTERTVSPVAVRALSSREAKSRETKAKAAEASTVAGHEREDSPPPALGDSLGNSKLLGLPSLDGILDLPKVGDAEESGSEEKVADPAAASGGQGEACEEAPADGKDGSVESDNAGTRVGAQLGMRAGAQSGARPGPATPGVRPGSGTLGSRGGALGSLGGALGASAVASTPPPPGSKVFVKNLDKTTSERELRELFSRHGAVFEVDIPRDPDTGATQGFSYVTLSSAEEAARAAKALNFTKPWGRALIVERQKEEGEADVEEALKDRSGAPAEVQGRRSASGAPEAEGTPAKKKTKSQRGKRRRRSRSESRSRSGDKSSGSSSSSHWSRYTIGSQAKRSRHQKRRQRGRRRRASSSRGSSRSRDDSRAGRMAEKASQPPMGWPHAPPPFLMGMPPHMMPPWALPPGAMPPWGAPQVSSMDFDREAAERALRKAERKAKREDKGKSKADQDRSPSRVPQRVRSSSGSAGSKSSDSESQRPRRAAGTDRRSKVKAPAHGPDADLAGKADRDGDHDVKDKKADSEDSDLDIGKVQEEINFADI
mmetsp:Transcript_66772/g.159724  ORF Transcript_66772/g.159724 Transcript_66772/m.159724 type:complete len:1228 (-) Transcript_66772:49-3732(-)